MDKNIIWQKFTAEKEPNLINYIYHPLLEVILMFIVMLLLLSLISSQAFAANQIEIRGQVTDLGEKDFLWNNKNFAGFYYDIDSNIGTEQIAFNLSNTNKQKSAAYLSDKEVDGIRGITYTTTAQPKSFKFEPWGQYMVLGFLGERYFAAYNSTPTKGMNDAEEKESYLYDQSEKSSNLMMFGQISRILIDSDAERTITSASSLELDENYELTIKSIDVDGNKVHVDLLKDGRIIDSKIVKPSMSNAKIKDKTYFFKANLEETEDVVTIAVHFRNAFQSEDTSIATVDGVFQISETPTSIAEGQQYDKMSIKEFDPTDMNIIMANKDNQIRLIKKNDILLMKDIYIKTANQDVIDSSNPLRYYIYKKYTEPGKCEIRGSIANLGLNSFTYTNATFPGFYYDIDNDIGAEQITFSPFGDDPASKTLSDQETNGLRGITYTTMAQPKNFKFEAWGQYKVICFLEDKYFAAYDNIKTSKMKNAGEDVSYPYDKSTKTNLMTNEQLAKISIDSNNEITVTSDNPLMLEDGYELAIKSIDEKGNKVNVELSKDGDAVDQKILQPSIDGATMADKTYCYDKASMGGSEGIVTIAVHFKDAFSGSGDNSAIIDGIFQISDTPTQLKVNQQYGKMSIRNVDPNSLSIIMDNKDQPITLSKNKKILLIDEPKNKNAAGDETAIYIKTADQEDIDASNPLRYYIYKNETIEE